jgi:hypothetical protein
MEITEVKTFQADIYVGFYDTLKQKTVGSIRKTHEICQEFCDDTPYCVSITPVQFIYHKGKEKGAKITLINYARLPLPNSQTIIYAKIITERLMTAFNQMRASIVTSTGTIMLSSENTD